MIERLRAPLSPGHSLAVGLAILAAVTLYCLAYTALAGRSESPAEAAGWAIINILPWLAAFEAGKRARALAAKALVLIAALCASLALGALFGAENSGGFELVRRIPGLLIVASLLVVAALPTTKRKERRPADRLELPLPLEAIEWVAAAGNYVELHGCGRVVMHRMPISALEAELAPKGFVRVHRSTLVRRDRIARVRPLDLVLTNGTILTTGKRYRSFLAERNFVPSSHLAGGG